MNEDSVKSGFLHINSCHCEIICNTIHIILRHCMVKVFACSVACAIMESDCFFASASIDSD